MLYANAPRRRQNGIEVKSHAPNADVSGSNVTKSYHVLLVSNGIHFRRRGSVSVIVLIWTRRGCVVLCPNGKLTGFRIECEIMSSAGALPSGEGSRSVIAATEHLRRKVKDMESRMRSLEDAIAIVHASNSDRPHPLLASQGDELEEEERQLELELEPVVENSNRDPSGLVEHFGTLFLDESGRSRFFGPSGGSEVCLIHICPFLNLTISFSKSLLLVRSFIPERTKSNGR